jgi:hypothetical protein
MFDELDRLRGDEALRRLLAHYTRAGASDREAWQDRLMGLEDVAPRELVRLHGELIAHGWVEQNTGVTPVRQRGVVGGCYRATAAGMRALKQAGAVPTAAADGEAA